MPKVSVIIPNYNHALFLNERIDSVLNQTFQDFEIIILDDVSTDNSRDVINQYKSNPKISHIIFNEINSGNTFKQWQKGIDVAKGDWIWIAESDDWCSDRFLETLMPDLIQDSSISISFSQSYIYMPEGKILIKAQNEKEKERFSKNDFYRQQLLKGNWIYNASMVVFNKKLFKEIQTREFFNYKYCGDWIIWAELSKKGDVIRHSFLLNNYRKTGSINVSSAVKNNGMKYIENLNALLYFRDHKFCSTDDFIQSFKWYYFNFKEESVELSADSKQKVIDYYTKILGNKRLLIWNFKFKKEKYLTKIYNFLKEKF